jgi:hypothetical protein
VTLATQATDCAYSLRSSATAGGSFCRNQVQNNFLRVRCAVSPWPSRKLHACCQRTVLAQAHLNACDCGVLRLRSYWELFLVHTQLLVRHPMFKVHVAQFSQWITHNKNAEKLLPEAQPSKHQTDSVWATSGTINLCLFLLSSRTKEHLP